MIMSKEDLKNSELYLYSINEARVLMRMNREKFVREFLKTGKIPITKIDGRRMIAFMDLRDFLLLNKYTHG